MTSHLTINMSELLFSGSPILVPLSRIDHRIEWALVAPHTPAQALAGGFRVVLCGRGGRDLGDHLPARSDPDALSAPNAGHVLGEPLPQHGDFDVFHRILLNVHMECTFQDAASQCPALAGGQRAHSAAAIESTSLTN